MNLNSRNNPLINQLQRQEFLKFPGKSDSGVFQIKSIVIQNPAYIKP